MSPAPTFPVQQVDRENTQSCVDEREQGGKKVQSNTTCLESNSLVSGCTLPLTSCMTSCQWLPFSQPPFLICKAGVGITSNCRVVLKIKCVNGLQQGLACRKPLRNTAPPPIFSFLFPLPQEVKEKILHFLNICDSMEVNYPLV